MPGGGSDNDQSCQFLLSTSCPTGSGRPTAQVLPVQTESALPSSTFSLTQSSYHPQSRESQSSLSQVSNPAHILTSYYKSWGPQLSSAEERMKLQTPGLCGAGVGFSGGVGVGMRQENLFSRLNMDRPLGLQDSLLCQGLAGAAVGLMVETSSAMTSTSNSLHHVSHPPLHFHLSSSSPSPSGYYSCLPISISLHPSGSGSAGVPVAAVSGNSYHSHSTSSTTPSSASSLYQSQGHTSSVCACTSCGCHENCGTYGTLPGYAMSGYLQPLSADPSLFSLGPLVHLSPLATTSNTGSTSFSYPINHYWPSPIYQHSPVSHDQHQGFALYQPPSIIGNGSQKRSIGSLSCYNCGSSGHKAEACKQPTMELAQQGLSVSFSSISLSQSS